jgi:dethiobiotin synthetase
MTATPTKIVLVTGTGTEIGKTWVTAELVRALQGRAIAVAARKPVQSFPPDATGPTDADVLAAATGEEPDAVCPAHRWLPCAMAPPMAADALGRAAFTIAELAAEVGDAASTNAVVLVESAGGVRSPLAHDGDTVTLAYVLEPDLVVLVADGRLGTINLVRLSADALAGHRLVVHLNRFDPGDELQRRNRDWLVTREGLEVVTDIEALAEILATLPTTTG